MVEKDFQEAGLGQEEGVDIEYEATVEEGLCTGVQDIIFTGETEERHGDAWCHYLYYGRLRPWDGLIVLVGVPVSNSTLCLSRLFHVPLLNTDSFWTARLA